MNGQNEYFLIIQSLYSNTSFVWKTIEMGGSYN